MRAFSTSEVKFTQVMPGAIGRLALARGGRGVGALPFRYKIYSFAGQASILHLRP